MTADIAAAIDRLHSQLPLQARQQALPPDLAAVHRGILAALATTGRPLERREIAALLTGGEDPDAVLRRLGADDLVVLNAEGTAALGAYPMTVEDTTHQLRVDGVAINAMCALDALSVASMYDKEVDIRSRCAVTGEPIHVRQRNETILEAEPSPEVRVGVRWQMPSTCAAHSMCMEMVFLKDAATAEAWQDGDTENVSIFTLPEAVAFGAGFFKPLVR